MVEHVDNKDKKGQIKNRGIERERRRKERQTKQQQNNTKRRRIRKIGRT